MYLHHLHDLSRQFYQYLDSFHPIPVKRKIGFKWLVGTFCVRPCSYPAAEIQLELWHWAGKLQEHATSNLAALAKYTNQLITYFLPFSMSFDMHICSLILISFVYLTILGIKMFVLIFSFTFNNKIFENLTKQSLVA